MSDLENKNTTATPLETVVAPVTPDASDAAKQAVERETISTQNVQDDLQELIASSTQPAVSAEKIDFSVNDDKKAKEDQKKLVIAEKQIPKKTLAMAAYSIIVALLAGFFYIIYAFFNYTVTGKIFPASFEIPTSFGLSHQNLNRNFLRILINLLSCLCYKLVRIL